MSYHKQFFVVRERKVLFWLWKKYTCMVEATQNSDTSNSSAAATAVAPLFSPLAFAANGLQVSMFQSSYISDCIMFVA